MGYGTMVYSVDFDKLRSVFGSGDDKTRRMISGRFRQDIYRRNDNIGWSNERGEPSIFEAIRHLIMGGEKTLPGAMYGYGYETIVEFYGRFLPNDRFYPCDTSWQQEHYQPQLDALGVELNLLSLSFGGALADFPPPDDFPGIGHWKPEAIKAAWAVMKDAQGLSREMEQVKSWLAEADRSNNGLVGFYY